MMAVGDLCHHTSFAVNRKENWITDQLGYRNDLFIKKSDVLLIGDSFIVCSGVRQDAILSNQIKQKTGLKVYNMAPASFNDFVALIQKGIIEKPKTLVLGFVERNIPEPLNAQVSLAKEPELTTLGILRDKFKRQYGLEYLKARLKGLHGNGLQSKTDPQLFFMNGPSQTYHYDQMEEVANTILSYKQFCDDENIKFVFVPLPNKETVYFDKVPLESEPNYISQLLANLQEEGVETLNLQHIFREERKKNEHLLYQLDDSHWNAKGIEIAASELANKLKNK